ncbi:hypothetical protein GTY59_01965 [Streptomyces sp. SID5466]|nr:hypothetical protein [Streptomyces sp. SID5466]
MPPGRRSAQDRLAHPRWTRRSSPAITPGYYAHFMPETGSKGRESVARGRSDPLCHAPA